MRKKILITTILIGLLALSFVGYGIGYGWFLNRSATESIDANTKGIVFSYEVTDGYNTKKDVLAYSVKNVAFFDKDSENEGKYFKDMALELKFEITNVCEYDLDVTLEFKPTEETTSAHLECLLTNTQITSTADYATVEDVLTAKKVGDSASKITIPEALKAKDETTASSTGGVASVYLYLFGVQPDDSATNDFLSKTYGFSVELSAVRDKSSD